MTLRYPDISHYQSGANLTGAPVVCAKATEATGYVDPSYDGFKAQCASKGIAFFAYHFLHGSSPGAQAAHAYARVGPHVPLMIDVEWVAGNNPRLSTVVDFTNAYRARGGIVHLAYVPHAYWAGPMGTPDLSVLTRMGVNIVNANYSAGYSDSGAGWTPYGHAEPRVWQYTDKHNLNGTPMDFNAYRGTLQQFLAMIGHGGTPASRPQPKEERVILIRKTGKLAVYASNYVNRRWVQSEAELFEMSQWMKAQGIDPDVKTVTNLDSFGVLVGPDPGDV